MDSTYLVPLIPQNCRKEETIVQICDALIHWEDVTNDIFKRINDRITMNQNHLKSIKERISLANSKVEKLRGAKKAIQVFSSSKYPAVDVNKKYVSIFQDIDIKLERLKVDYEETCPAYEPLEKLHFYHVKIQEKEHAKVKEGLGAMPNNVETVNDLLLYNTGKNPYRKYVMSDTLHLTHRLKEEENPDGGDIGAAPLSISDARSQATIKNSNDAYFYSPDLGQVPTIDVPLDLPDLPGIADDLRYMSEVGPGIAPSVTTTPVVPDLPSIPVQQEESVPEILQELVESAPLPPPPPPVPIPIHVPTPASIPVPPPAAPPFVEKAPHPTKASPERGDMIANLMESIRNAGGSGKAKLRSTDRKSPEPSSKSGGNLMDDLHAKLSMRRKGISGAKNMDSGIDSTSTLSKLSSMIPPPPTKTDTTDTNTEDDDWD